MRALAEQLPRVQATESLRHAAEVALGSGVLKKEDARALREQWLAQAEAARPRKATSVADLERAAANLGIPIEVVPRA